MLGVAFVLALLALGVALAGLFNLLFVRGRRRLGARLLGGGLLGCLGALIWFGMQADAQRESDPQESAQRELRQAECQADLACWAQQHRVDATIACQPEIERLARFRFEWTDGMLGQKLTRYAWAGEPGGPVAYLGDAIQFENGFGAMQRHIYACTFDAAAGRVLAVEAEPGRLD